jgi:tetratricopeptide (TPR) repeat protein/predicted Ser/Thr protein kinase
MGEVYLAEDTRLKRPVALKRLPPRLRDDQRYRQRFVKEAERASALSYQHIAGIYDVFEENSELFLVMEYVEGKTLRQRLAEPLSIADFLDIAVQCAEALVAAHKKGIVHRDIKPANIMLTPKNQVKILDFGVAKQLPHSDPGAITESANPDPTAGLSGTPAYMAPEVLVEKEADGRADIFSLGIVFYEALTGHHPFRGPSFMATADRILHELPSPLRETNPGVPAELDRIVGKMLAKDPAARYATAADLLVDLHALQRAPGYALPRPAVPKAFARFRWALLAAVVLALVAVAVWRVLLPTPRPVERIRVAALPFANLTGDERLERYRLTLAQMLVLDLTGSPNIRIFPYERLLEIIRGFEAEGKDVSSPNAIRAVAAYSNSQFVLVPAMFAVGNTWRVSVEFRDAQTGEMVGAAKVERALSGSAEDTLYSMLGQLEDGIQAYFKKAGRGAEYQPRPEGSRPQTAIAALHLTEGRTAFAQGKYAEALNSFQMVIKEDPRFALAFAWMGQIYGLLGYDNKARELSQQAAQLITSETPVTDAYFIEANLAERKYDYSAAEAKYRELIRLYPDDPVWHAALAGVYEKQGQYQKAITSYQEALRRDSNYSVAHQELGVLYTRTDNLPQALTHVQKVLNLYRALGNREGEASALVVLAEALRLKGEHQQAKDSAQSALQLFHRSQNEFGVLWATKLLGDIRFNEGDYKEARRYYQQVVSASGEIRNNRLLVLALMNSGVTYHREGDLPKGVEYYERSLAQGTLYGEYKDWPSLRGRALALINLGSIFIEYGPSPQRGFQLVQEGLSIFQMMGNTHWVAHDQALLGLYSMNAGRYPTAMQQFQQAESLYRTVADTAGLAYSIHYIGRCYFLQNQYEQALKAFADALALLRDRPDRFWTAYAQIHLGWTYRRLGDTLRARALLGGGFEAAQKNGFGEMLPDALNGLGELYWDAAQREQARESFARAWALRTEPHIFEFSIEAQSNLGLLLAEQGNVAGGLSDCQESTLRARKLERVHTLARTLINLARVHLLRKDYKKALELADEISSLGAGRLGLEWRAQAFFLRSKALEGLHRPNEAKSSSVQAQQTIRTLLDALATDHRASFAARRDIRPLLPGKNFSSGQEH